MKTIALALTEKEIRELVIHFQKAPGSINTIDIVISKIVEELDNLNLIPENLL